MLPAYPTGERRADFRARALHLLEQFSIARHAAQRVELLSGGELQRVAIARALINNPAIIIADEPTAHLDSKLSQEFMAIVGQMKEEGKTVLIASHDPIVFDSPLIDSLVEMRDGAVVQSRNFQ
jgi:putative ABC transport system ATP-binding protein